MNKHIKSRPAVGEAGQVTWCGADWASVSTIWDHRAHCGCRYRTLRHPDLSIVPPSWCCALTFKLYRHWFDLLGIV